MIEIDIGSFMPVELLHQASPAVHRVIMHDVADAARAKWVRAASEKLHTSQQAYTAGITPVSTTDESATIRLVGVFPNMIERGFAEFDLRDTLLRAGLDGVRETADGHRYRYLFFRRGGGRTTGRNFPRVTDLYAAELGKKRAQTMGRRAMREVKQLRATTSQIGGRTQWGERLPAGAGGSPKKRQGGMMALKKGQQSPAGHPLRADHKTDLMAGAYHFVQHYERATQSFTGVFRTISTRDRDLEGDPTGKHASWMHPGYKPGVGANLVGEVQRYIDRLAPAMMANLSTGLRGG